MPAIPFRAMSDQQQPPSAYRRQWAEQIQSCLLPVEYYHVIMTVPRPVTQFGMANRLWRSFCTASRS